MQIISEEPLHNHDEEQVRHHAYMLWLEEGQPEGRAEAHWHQAIEATPGLSAVETTAAAEAISKKTI